MKFFTDITTNVSNFCLLNIKRYGDLKKYLKKLIFIDPSVYELKNSDEYSSIELLEKLTENTRKNEFISIDYPSDMNEAFTNFFIVKTRFNNIKHKSNPKYINTIQSKCNNFESFKTEMDFYISNNFPVSKYWGLGNMCRIMRPTNYSDNVVNYILKSPIKKLHIYGLALRLIKKYVPILESSGIEISIDSTKWTRAVNNQLKAKYGVCCRKNTRDIYFLKYIEEIKRYVEKVEY